MKKKINGYFFATALIFLTWGNLMGQSPDSHPKTTFVDSTQNLYIQQSLSVGFYMGTATNGADSLQFLPLQNRQADPAGGQFQFPENGTYELSLKRVDVGGKAENVRYRIHADGLPPTVNIHFSGAQKATKAGMAFYGPGLEATLTAQDNMAGVKQAFYQLTDTTYRPYRQPIAIGAAGEYWLRYYATDQVGNVTIPQEVVFSVDISAPKTNLALEGIQKETVLAASTKIKLESLDEGAGVKEISYRFDQGEYKLYKGQPLGIGHLPDGNHTLTYFATDQVGNRENPQAFSFYLDKIAPFAKFKISGEQYRGNQLYVAPSARIVLLSVDNQAGVEKIVYSIDGAKEQVYEKPIALQQASGGHRLTVYAVDQVGNTSEADSETIAVYFDDQPPALNHRFEGAQFLTRDTLYTKSGTELHLEATDADAGVKTVSWQMDGGKKLGAGTGPIVVEGEGLHHLTYQAIDQVGNQSEGEVVFFVDDTPPTLNFTFSTPDLGTKAEGEAVYTLIPAHCQIYLSATDQKTGADEIYYTLNGGEEQLYVQPLAGFKPGASLVISLKATDQLGNAITESIRLIVGE